MSSRLIQDITPATDAWERNYAHLEYLRVGLLRTFSTRIYVQEKILGDYYDADWQDFEAFEPFLIDEVGPLDV